MNQFKTLIVGILLIAVLVIALLLKIGGKDIDLLKVKTTEEFKPAVIYDMGGKFDKSFNEGVYNGIKAFYR
jgi:basic membrane lipoprotein Med (substrate-binding protein (PBP1-ABC) superfamily)